jgi:hypothetical protein
LICRLDAGREELARGEGELIALLARALDERAAAIKPGAATPGAGELTVDEGDEAAIGARRREPVGRNEGVIGGAQERRLGGRQGEQRLGRRRGALASLAGAGGGVWAAAGVGSAPLSAVATAVPAAPAPLRKLRLGMLS